jgi:hypothetical protein
MPKNQSPPPFYKENPFWGAIGGFLTFLIGGLGFEVSGYQFLGKLVFWLALPWAVMATWLLAGGLTENRKHRNVTKIVGVAITVLGMVMIQYLVRPPEAMFHIVAAQGVLNMQNPNQLLANVYIQNDAGDAEVVNYAANSLVTNSAGLPGDDDRNINELWKDVKKDEEAGGGTVISIPAKETRWFTNPSVILPDEQVRLYKKGWGKFYFVGDLIIKEKNATNTLSYCAYVIGDNPAAVIGCSASERKKH